MRRRRTVAPAGPAHLAAFDPRRWGWTGSRLDAAGLRTQGNLDAFDRFLTAREQWEREHPDELLPEVPADEYHGDVAWTPV